MSFDKEWETIRAGAGIMSRRASIGLLRLTMLFGSVAVAIALLLTPMLAERGKHMASRPVLDTISTGTVPKGRTEYTLRRSVLQASPTDICRISPDGRRTGQC